ncbi:hypothetical protein GLYMA_03G033850v4 [Glycine max]|nr:hypothetical protein GLYMA_03G033850v4 [Glycine max]
MEFKYCAGQNQRTLSPMLNPLFTIPCMNPDIFGHPLQGNVDNVYQREFKIESRQREPKKAEIKREIIAYEIALSRRRELKEEVKRKMTSQKASRIQINDKIRGDVTS